MKLRYIIVGFLMWIPSVVCNAGTITTTVVDSPAAASAGGFTFSFVSSTTLSTIPLNNATATWTAGTVTAGDLITVQFGYFTNSGSTASFKVHDNAVPQNQFSIAVSSYISASSFVSAIYYLVSTGTTNSSYSISCFNGATTMGFSGNSAIWHPSGGTASADVSTGGTGTATTYDTGNTPTTSANATLAVATVWNNTGSNPGNVGLPTNFTGTLYQQLNGAFGGNGISDGFFRTGTNFESTTVNASSSTTASAHWAAVIATFKAQ